MAEIMGGTGGFTAEIFKSCFCVTSLTDSAKAISEGASLKYISPIRLSAGLFVCWELI